MDLICKQRHMFGTKIDVDGQIYTIGGDGRVEGVAVADARVLLQNQRCFEKAPDTPLAKATRPARAPAASMATFVAPDAPPPSLAEAVAEEAPEAASAPVAELPASALDLLGLPSASTPAPESKPVQPQPSAAPARGRKGKE